MITRHHCSTALLSFLASLVIATTTTYPPLDKINLLVNSLSTQCQSDTACEIIVTAAPPCVDAHCACVLQYHASNCIRECERSSDAVNLFNDYLDACLTASLALPTATQTVYGGSCEPISSATGADGAPGSSGGTIYTMSEAVPTQVGAVQSFAGQLGGTIYTLENDPSTQAEALPTSAGQLGGTDLSQGTIYTNGNGQDETSLIPSGTQGAGFVQCSCSTAGLETGEETGARPGGPIYAMGETGVSTLNGASRTNQSPTGAMAGSAPVLTTYPGPADLLPSVKRPELNTTTNATTTQAVALNSTNSFFGSAIPEECVVPCQAWKDQADSCPNDSCLCIPETFTAARDCNECVGSSGVGVHMGRSYSKFSETCQKLSPGIANGPPGVYRGTANIEQVPSAGGQGGNDYLNPTAQPLLVTDRTGRTLGADEVADYTTKFVTATAPAIYAAAAASETIYYDNGTGSLPVPLTTLFLPFAVGIALIQS